MCKCFFSSQEPDYSQKRKTHKLACEIRETANKGWCPRWANCLIITTNVTHGSGTEVIRFSISYEVRHGHGRIYKSSCSTLFGYQVKFLSSLACFLRTPICRMWSWMKVVVVIPSNCNWVGFSNTTRKREQYFIRKHLCIQTLLRVCRLTLITPLLWKQQKYQYCDTSAFFGAS